MENIVKVEELAEHINGKVLVSEDGTLRVLSAGILGSFARHAGPFGVEQLVLVYTSGQKVVVDPTTMSIEVA